MHQACRELAVVVGMDPTSGAGPSRSPCALSNSDVRLLRDLSPEDFSQAKADRRRVRIVTLRVVGRLIAGVPLSNDALCVRCAESILVDYAGRARPPLIACWVFSMNKVHKRHSAVGLTGDVHEFPVKLFAG